MGFGVKLQEENQTIQDIIDWEKPQLLLSKDSGLIVITNGNHKDKRFEATVIKAGSLHDIGDFSSIFGKRFFKKGSVIIDRI